MATISLPFAGYQPQSVSLKQIVNPNQQPYPINRAAVPAAAQQNVLTQPSPQYRPAAQSQVRPVNSLLNQNFQKLPTHQEERRMATEVNQQAIGKPQPNYTLSNSKDDVDDVIVRPMASMQMRAEQPFVDQKPQHQQPVPPPSKPQESRIPASVLQNNGNIDANTVRQAAQPPKHPDSLAKASPPTKMVEPKKVSPVEPTKQNGTPKANVCVLKLIAQPERIDQCSDRSGDFFAGESQRGAQRNASN